MKIVVCIRQGIDGELNPFDACAYEEALKIRDSEIILLSMGPIGVKELMQRLTRLGAKSGVLLCDSAFAGADTLATAYTLSKAIKKLKPDFVFCGRQTLIGDTGQTPPMLSELLGYQLITSVMEIQEINENEIFCKTRNSKYIKKSGKTLITIEKINTLRLPKLRSSVGEIEVWDNNKLQANSEKCGLVGSPTRVLKTFENQSGKRKCKFISMEQLDVTIKTALSPKNTQITTAKTSKNLLKNVMVVGSSPLDMARTVSDDIISVELNNAKSIADKILELKPSAVIFGSDHLSKELSAIVAARLGLGLCANCTELDCENGELIMYRPALSGSVIAKIKSLTAPAMATVITDDGIFKKITVALGYGVKNDIERAITFANTLGADIVASRKLVDNGYMPYSTQVGLTGMTVSPPIYIAIGISGAVHHIAGMHRSNTVIAINPDKNAPIFEYADFGITEVF